MERYDMPKLDLDVDSEKIFDWSDSDIEEIIEEIGKRIEEAVIKNKIKESNSIQIVKELGKFSSESENNDDKNQALLYVYYEPELDSYVTKMIYEEMSIVNQFEMNDKNFTDKMDNFVNNILKCISNKKNISLEEVLNLDCVVVLENMEVETLKISALKNTVYNYLLFLQNVDKSSESIQKSLTKTVE